MTTPTTSLRDVRAPEEALAWLLPFRWAAVGIEAALILLASRLGGPAVEPWAWLVLGLQGASTLAARALAGRGAERSRLAGLLLILDAAFLTALFAASGGPANPFTIFYLVLIVFSALVLRPVWSWATAITSVAGFSLLFALPANPGIHIHHGGFSGHLRGMWAAFAAAAAATALFVTLLREARDRRERDLERLRDLAGRYDRLAALSTFAASAAHELATPLGTVALAAERLASGKLDRAAVMRTADGIGDDIARCRRLLDELAGKAGESIGEAPRRIEPAALVERALGQLTDDERGRVSVRVSSELPPIVAPERGAERSLAALLKNAIEASPDGAPIELLVGRNGGRIAFRVADRGMGVASDLAQRVGEPFLTTKGAHGLGLGLFAASRLAELLGGAFALEPRTGGGTVATFELPAGARAEPSA